jgi:acyl-CoA thioester hydrolase
MSDEQLAPQLADFPLQTYDKVRYADTDRQGHVNNAMFSTYLETGRVEFMSDPAMGVLDDNATFVIANASLNLLGEISWPGTVEIGTRVVKIGNSSVSLNQGLYQSGKLVATADTVIVQMNESTRKSHPLTDFAKQTLFKYS